MQTVLRAVMMLCVGIAIFAGLPLLGWGLGDLHGFAANPVRLGYIILTVLLQVVVVVGMPGVGRANRIGKKLVRRQRLALLLLQVLPLMIVIGAPWSDRRDVAVMSGFEGSRYLGLALFAAGFLMMNRAQMSLGKRFSVQVTIQEGHTLMTDGLYRYLRHPRYLGIILFAAGIALVFRSWLGLVLTALVALVLLWRIHDEEALLRREFGGEWDAYAQKSWRLIPFVY